jgi:hypothetical protein
MEFDINKLSRRDFLKLAGVIPTAAAASSFFPNLVASADSLWSPDRESASSVEYVRPCQMSLILVPTSRDWTFNNTGGKPREPVQISISDPITFQIRNPHYIEINGQTLKVGEVPLCGGGFAGSKDHPEIPRSADQYIGLVVLGTGGKALCEQVPNSCDILGAYAGTLMEGASPTKIWNMLNSAKKLLTYQENAGGFNDGNYSFLQLQNSLRDGSFKTGLDWSDSPVIGQGADAVATILSKALFPMTLFGNAQILDRTPHATGFGYFGGPSAPEITDDATDADIEVNATSKQTTDFAWSFNGLGKVYLWAEASIIPNATNWNSDGGWLNMPSDARIILSLSIRKSPPGPEMLQRIQSLMNNYLAYHAGGPGSVAALALGQSVSEVSGDWETMNDLIEAIHPELVTADFAAEINGSDQGAALANLKQSLINSEGGFGNMSLTEINKLYFALVYYIQGLTADYSKECPYTLEDYKAGKKRPVTGLGSYLGTRMRNDGVFESLQQMSGPAATGKALMKFEYALGDLRDYSYIIPGEALQCLGWAELLGSLIAFPITPSFIGDVPTGSASGLLSDATRETLKTTESCSDGRLKYFRVNSAGDVKVGDMFVRYGDKDNHIGTVIGKKLVNGKTKLLLTDANRKNDGVIRVFEVDDDNFPEIFGDVNS